MEIDSPDETTTSTASNGTLAVHPLAIVNMSDQYSRIRSGGSPLPRTSAITGILWGTTSVSAFSSTTATGATSTMPGAAVSVLQNRSSAVIGDWNGCHCEIQDAEEVPLDMSESAQLQLELHQAVFPSHSVVGWYRVGDTMATTTEEDVTESDVRMTELLHRHYCSDSSSTFVFALLVMDVKKTYLGDHRRGEGEKEENEFVPGNHDNVNDDDDDDGDDEEEEETGLPLFLYRHNFVDGTLHHVPDWTLETGESERIAVERVLRDPSATATAQNNSSTSSASTNPSPLLVQHTLALDHSLTYMSRRVEVLRLYLKDTVEGKVPWNPSLMRQINQLVTQMEAIQRNPQHQENSDKNNNKNDDHENRSHLSKVNHHHRAHLHHANVDRYLVDLNALAEAVDAMQQFVNHNHRNDNKSNSSNKANTSATNTSSSISSIRYDLPASLHAPSYMYPRISNRDIKR